MSKQYSNPDQLFEQLKSSTNKGFVKRRLDLIHSICSGIYEKGLIDFTLPTIASISKANGGPGYDIIQANLKYRSLINCWADLAGGYTKQIDSRLPEINYNSLTPFQVLEELNKYATTHVKKHLAIIHNACLEQFEKKEKDFTVLTIGKIVENNGGIKLSTFRARMQRKHMYRILLKCWANHADGFYYTKDRENPPIDYDNLEPEELYNKILSLSVQKMKLQNFKIVNAACKKQFDSKKKDFTATTIHAIASGNKDYNLKPRSIAATKDYIALRSAWARKAKGYSTFDEIPQLPYASMNKDDIISDIKKINDKNDSLHPDFVLDQLQDQSHTKKKRSLKIIHDICREQYEKGNKDFTLRTIGKLSTDQKGLQCDSMKHSVFYRVLIETWADFAGGFSGSKIFSQDIPLFDSSLTPEDVLIRLKNHTTPMARESLDKIHEICFKLSERGNKDFSYDTMFQLIAKKNILTTDALQGKSGQRLYKPLIESWAEYANGFIAPELKKDDIDFFYLLKVDHSLNDWRILAVEWFKEKTRGRGPKAQAIDKFLLDYISQLDLERNPYIYLRRDYDAPPFDIHLEKNLSQRTQIISNVHNFIEWILKNKLSIFDDNNNLYVPHEFHNPITIQKEFSNKSYETHRVPLPYRYIRECRSILNEGPNFEDWKWAQSLTCDYKVGAGHWFEVDPKIIDENDPDCVWRMRKTNVYGNKGNIIGKKQIYEMWSPVAAVAMLIKLELPLRTFQIRMLDSGEADTWRYEKNGEWQLNSSPLTNYNQVEYYMRGVFHRSIDHKSRKVMTGLYINTNKTADIDKPEKEKGYVIPWQNETVLYWLEKLRNWQQKYNPISKPTKWSDLSEKYFGKRIGTHKDILEKRGLACFLFRDPTRISPVKKGDTDKPILNSDIAKIWYNLLHRLEENCVERGETLDDGSKIEFLDPEPNSEKTNFDLHSLRVSLITAYAIDGGLPIEVLSKLIAGHSRLIMTLYYTKIGKASITELLEKVESELLEKEKDSYRRWLKDATYRQIETRFAMNDPSAAYAASQPHTNAALVFTDLGICPYGLLGCDIGGEIIKDNKNPNKRLYGKVPGFPEKNCVRCRFLLTSPAFLPGLVDHFNYLSWKIKEASHPYCKFENLVKNLEDERYSYEANKLVFPKISDLHKANTQLEESAKKCFKLVLDLQSTFKLIDRCIEINEAQGSEEQFPLIANGTINEIKYAIDEVDSEMHQLEVICQNAVLYPNHDCGKANLRRTQILDAMLELNNRKPILYKLTEEQQLITGNRIMQLVKARVGNFPEAVEIAEGKRLLKDIGLLEKTDAIIKDETNKLPVSMPMKSLFYNS